nr:barstar family protein [Gottfriedia luciferensis]
MDKKSKAPNLIIEVTNVRTNKELHLLLKEKLKFPEYYGENWDAFWETITGIVELPNKIEFVGWSEFARRLPEDSLILKEYLLEHNQEFPEWKCDILFN